MSYDSYLNLTSDFSCSMGILRWTFSFVRAVIIYTARSILLDVLSVNYYVHVSFQSYRCAIFHVRQGFVSQSSVGINNNVQLYPTL